MKITGLVCFVVLHCATGDLIAQWNSNTTINTAVAIAAKSQQNVHCIPDTKNGVIIAWDDNRNNLLNSTDIYAQRLNSDGIPKWANNGMAVCSNTATQGSVAIIGDGNGGAILAWEDNRSGNYDIYAQKIDSSGNYLWTADGVIITNGTTNQKNPKIINDHAGGAIVVWEDSVNNYFDIYAQRINSSGTAVWATNGISICNAPNNQNNPKLDTDGLDGAIIVWQDKRNSIDYDIYAQKIDTSGTILWAANGIVVCNAANTQNNPRIEPDGINGAVIAWTDKRAGIDYDIYAQHLNSTGVPQWSANGISVCNSINNQSALDLKYLGANNIALSWKDQRNGKYDIYTQLLSLSGAAIMAVNGVKISNALKSLNPNNIADGLGGAIIAWEDSTSSGWNISSQKTNSSGVLQWPYGGVTVSNAAGDQINVSQVSDGSGGAIYVWEDYRNMNDYDLFAQRINNNGNAIKVDETLSSSGSFVFYPNPATHFATIHIKNTSIKPFKVNSYDTEGKLVKEYFFQNQTTITISIDDLPSGIYHYSISDKEGRAINNGNFIIEK